MLSANGGWYQSFAGWYETDSRIITGWSGWERQNVTRTPPNAPIGAAGL